MSIPNGHDADWPGTVRIATHFISQHGYTDSTFLVDSRVIDLGCERHLLAVVPKGTISLSTHDLEARDNAYRGCLEGEVLRQRQVEVERASLVW